VFSLIDIVRVRKRNLLLLQANCSEFKLGAGENPRRDIFVYGFQHKLYVERRTVPYVTDL